MKVYYLVYKLTNLVNGKIYIGCHMTKDVNDDYMGSGRRIGYAIKKYGVENFKKEILSTHDTPEQMLTEEARLVNEEFLGRKDVYNLALGGKGGWFYVNQDPIICEKLRQIRSTFKHDKRFSEWGKIGGTLTGAENRAKVNKNKESIQRKVATRLKNSNNDYGKCRRGLKLAVDCHRGEKNSQFDTCWIFNIDLKRSIKIKITLLSSYIENGWIKGRRIKF
jgi:hypothetical protein